MKTSILAIAILGALVAVGANAIATIPGSSGSEGTPEVDTLGVPSEPVDTPAVDAPATCTESFCTQGSETGPIGTPPIPVCVPAGTGCLFGGTVNPVTILPSQPIPALCETPAGVACLSQTEVLPAQHQQTPGEPPMQVLPAGFVAVQYSLAETDVGVPQVGVGTISNYPISTPIGDFYLCQNTTCPYPMVSPGTVSGGVAVFVTVDGQTEGGSFPLSA